MNLTEEEKEWLCKMTRDKAMHLTFLSEMKDKDNPHKDYHLKQLKMLKELRKKLGCAIPMHIPGKA